MILFYIIYYISILTNEQGLKEDPQQEEIYRI